MLLKDILSYIDRQLRSIMPDTHRNIPFGGKCILLGGDWKQLTPVVPKSSWVDQVQASVKNSDLFKQFETLRFLISNINNLGIFQVNRKYAN